MIRVLHVVDLPGPNHWLNGVAEHYDRTRFRHMVASVGARNGLHESLAARDVPAFSLDAPRRRQLFTAVRRLADLMRREQVDIVQTHTFDPTTIGLLAARAAGTPLTVLTRHHADFSTIFRKPIHRQIDRWHALCADRVWAPSQFIKRCMMTYEGVPDDRITVIPHGFDFELMKPSLDASARAELRGSVGGEGKFLIGMVARLSIEKGHEYLLRAVPEIIARHPEARFVMIGSGPLREPLEALAAQLGVAEHVVFLGWRWDAWALIEAMDLIVHPSLHEPFGIVYVESMALERAVITTSESAAPEIIDHGETGLIVPPRDPAALVEAVSTLMRNKGLAAQLGHRARQRAVEKFSFSNMIREYERYYVDWLGACSSQTAAV